MSLCKLSTIFFFYFISITLNVQHLSENEKYAMMKKGSWGENERNFNMATASYYWFRGPICANVWFSFCYRCCRKKRNFLVEGENITRVSRDAVDNRVYSHGFTTLNLIFGSVSSDFRCRDEKKMLCRCILISIVCVRFHHIILSRWVPAYFIRTKIVKLISSQARECNQRKSIKLLNA